MGPRSCERGNGRLPAGQSPFLQGLQWGRARASAEIALAQPRAPESREASMGPRSCERGNTRPRYHGLVVTFTASMGPRSCERGNLGSRQTARSSYSCFNGAALVRARKSPPPHASHARARSRFNGAALVRARKWTPLPSSWISMFICFNGAALVRARKFPDAVVRLGNDYAALQWGRARASAEM